MTLPLGEDERTTLVAKLALALGEQPGQFATELARLVGAHKKVLNPILYSDDQFRNDGSTKPRWFLAADAPEHVASAPQEPSRSNSHVAIIDDDDVEEIDETQLLRFTKVASEPRRPHVFKKLSSNDPFGLYDWQRDALERWNDAGRRGIIDAVTGAGKTRLAVAAIAEHIERGGCAVVIVPTVVLLHQWVEVVSATLPERRVGRVGDGYDDGLEDVDVLVAVVASARSRAFLLRGRPGLLVVDECHRAASDKNQEALDDRFIARLGLSATHERLDSAHETVLLPYFGRVVATLGYQRAISDGVISNVRVAFVGVNFSPEEQQRYEKVVFDLKAVKRTLVRTYGCRRGPFSAFLDDVLRLTRTGPLKASMVANRWLTLWREKRVLLAETPAKLAAIGSFTGAIADADRTLLFTQSITSANQIVQELAPAGCGVAAHHSQLETSEREDIMSRFSSGELRVLASVQTLEEGVDVPDADLAVIVASSKQRRQMVQRMGRIMRRKADGRDARFIILYVKGTDEDPRMGAHELFIDELLDVSRESELFAIEQVNELRAFLDPRRL
jgi:superfamily II DNA or RNA helicase